MELNNIFVGPMTDDDPDTNPDWDAANTRKLAMKLAIKCADVSNPARPVILGLYGDGMYQGSSNN